MEALEIPKIVQAIAIAFNCLPEVNGTTLLLSTALTLDVGQKKSIPLFPLVCLHRARNAVSASGREVPHPALDPTCYDKILPDRICPLLFFWTLRVWKITCLLWLHLSQNAIVVHFTVAELALLKPWSYSVSKKSRTLFPSGSYLLLIPWDAHWYSVHSRFPGWERGTVLPPWLFSQPFNHLLSPWALQMPS